MKRQSKKQGPATSSEKKIKTEAEKMVPKEENENASMAAAVAVAAAVEAEEMELLWGLGLKNGDVDEQMSWGTVWFPFWDVGRNYGDLFNDVVWDYDIWNLRSFTEIPQHVNVVANDSFRS